MSQVVIRGNLSSANFPLLAELSGRSIVVRQYDQNYTPPVSSKEDADKDIGIPELLYCENVLPTEHGYQSVGYSSPVNSAGVTFADCVESNGYTFACTSGAVNRKVFVLGLVGDWVEISATVLLPTYMGKLHVAVLNGVIYLLVIGSTVGIYSYDPNTQALSVVTLTGITLGTTVLGMLACQGYLLIYTNKEVYWSSLVTPTDFTPSLATGAGGGAVQALKGDIITCVPHTTGFLIYSTENIIAVPYSGNNRYPFIFREIPSSAGLLTTYTTPAVASDPTTGNHYAVTKAGLQLVSMQQSQGVFPDVSDFLANGKINSFNQTTNTISISSTVSISTVRLTTVADRYLFISYGTTTGSPYLDYENILIYDSVLKRWGKLVHNHKFVITSGFRALVDTRAQFGKNTFNLLTYSGQGYAAVTSTEDISGLTASGVAVIGKYQHVRSRLIQLQTVEVENVKSTSTFSCSDLYTLDGKTFNVKDGTLLYSTQNLRKYGFGSVVGVNHSLLFKGAFNLVTIQLAFNIHGRR